MKRRFAYAWLGFSSALILFRCFLGFDYTDEAQYLAQAIVPLLGGRAFDTDLFLQQTPSLLLMPVMWLYRLVFGPTGTVLFFRLIWWAAATATMVTIFRRFKIQIGPLPAALISSLTLFFIPFNIPSPSYNSFGLLFLTLGLVQQQYFNRYQMFWLMLATICYPPFGVAISIVVVFGYQQIGTWWKKNGRLYTSLISVLLISLIVLWPRLQESYEFTKQFGTFFQGEKATLLKTQLRFLVSPSIWNDLYPRSHYVILAAALITFPMGFILRSTIPSALMLASLACGLASALSSSNGIINFAIGGFPVILIFGIKLAAIKNPRAKIAASALVLLLILGLSEFLLLNPYRESPFKSLTSQVTQGAYKYIWTTPERTQMLTDLQGDLDSLVHNPGTILFFYNFPAGYLLTDFKPQTHMLNLLPYPYSDELRAKLVPRPHESYPTWVVKMNLRPSTEDAAINWDYTGGPRYMRYIHREQYSIFRLQK